MSTPRGHAHDENVSCRFKQKPLLANLDVVSKAGVIGRSPEQESCAPHFCMLMRDWCVAVSLATVSDATPCTATSHATCLARPHEASSIGQPDESRSLCDTKERGLRSLHHGISQPMQREVVLVLAYMWKT